MYTASGWAPGTRMIEKRWGRIPHCTIGMGEEVRDGCDGGGGGGGGSGGPYAHLHDPRLRDAALGHLGEGDRDVALQIRIARAREADERGERAALVERAVGVGDARKLAEGGGGLDLHANVLRLGEVVQQLEAALGEEERHAGLLRADRRARVRHLARDRRVDAGDADAVDHARHLAGAEGALHEEGGGP